MKKITASLLCLLLMLTLFITATATEPKIVDYADLLTAGEEAKLEQKAQQIVSEYQMDVVIVTVESLGSKTSEAYADDYFDYNGYGIGEDYSGVLLLISMEERDWAISTCGDAIYALTDYGIQKLFSSFSSDLSAGYYYDAFDTYLDELPGYFEALSNDTPVDGYPGDYDGPGTYYPGTSDDIIYYPNYRHQVTAGEIIGKLLLALVIGCAVAALVVWLMAMPMKSTKKQSGADNYIQQSSFHLRSCQDFFLYSRTSRVRRSEDSGGGHGGGGHRSGGSSVHRSSSGRSHGGGHGKF